MRKHTIQHANFVIIICNVILVLSALGVLAAAFPAEISASAQFSESGVVVKVVDGDTVDVNIKGKVERLRLIGMNTPETKDPRRPVQCFGREASARAKKLLLNKSVKLEADPSQSNRDRYKRLLRYIWIEGKTLFNLQMIREGYAYEYTYQGQAHKYQKEFKQAQQEAEKGQKGLWHPDTCAGELKAVTDAGSQKSESQQTEKRVYGEHGNCNIKGNISKKTNEKIYHVPGGQYYTRTKIDESAGEQWFCSETDAQKAGWRTSKR